MAGNVRRLSKSKHVGQTSTMKLPKPVEMPPAIPSCSISQLILMLNYTPLSNNLEERSIAVFVWRGTYYLRDNRYAQDYQNLPTP